VNLGKDVKEMPKVVGLESIEASVISPRLMDYHVPFFLYILY